MIKGFLLGVGITLFVEIFVLFGIAIRRYRNRDDGKARADDVRR